MVTCTADPDAKIRLMRRLYKGGDSAWRMRVPAFSDELRFQSGGANSRGHILAQGARLHYHGRPQADAVTWFDNGSWVTSSSYGSLSFIDDS